MKQKAQEEPRGGLAEIPHGMVNKVREDIGDILAVMEVEVRKLRHDPTELVSRAFQPALWILIFGEVLARTSAIPTGNVNYLDFLVPGILAQGVLFVSIFYGIAVIWERDLGIVYKLLSSPAPRFTIIVGKALAASVRSFSQALVVYLLAILLGVSLSFSAYSILAVIFFIILGSAIFSTFSLIIACIVKTRERFMGIGQLLTMPLFFASNAIYPISIMPGWLAGIAVFNPLTYEVDALRSLMLVGVPSAYGLGMDAGVLIFTALVLVYIGTKLYPRMAT